MLFLHLWLRVLLFLFSSNNTINVNCAYQHKSTSTTELLAITCNNVCVGDSRQLNMYVCYYRRSVLVAWINLSLHNVSDRQSTSTESDRHGLYPNCRKESIKR